jgi:endonuclease-3
MTKKERFSRVIDYFLTNMPVAETELEYRDPYELLVAVILSAQCTDKRVNIVTRRTFHAAFRMPKVSQMASADEVFTYISSVSYP